MIAANMLVLAALVASAQQSGDPPTRERMLNGYVQGIRGENIGYRSFHPYAQAALLTRCTDGKQVIEWKTEEIPLHPGAEFATYAWIAGHSSGTSIADATFRLAINGTEWFKFTTIKSRPVRQWTLNGRDGAQLSFDAKMGIVAMTYSALCF